MFSMRWFSTIFMIFLLTACGGGGSIEKDTSGDGGNDTDEYAIALSLNSQSGSSELSVSNPIQVQAKITKDGQAQADRLVKFVGDEFSEFNGSTSALTNSEGIATVGIVANNNQGAGTITASFDVNSETLTKSIEYAAMGDGGTQIALAITDANGNAVDTTNRLAGENPATVMATLTSNGTPLTGQILTFTFDELISTASNGKIVTDANGQASFQINATRQTGAGSIVVTYGDITNSTNFVSDGYEFFGLQVYALSVVGLDQQGNETNDLSFSSPIAVRATLTLNGKPLANEPLVFTVNKALIGSATNVLKTDEQGVVTFNLIDNNESGVGQLNVTYETPGTEIEDVSSSISFESEGDGGLQMQVQITDPQGNVISEQNPLDTGKNGSVSINLLDNGQPLSGAIVSVNAGTKGITLPSDGRVETNSSGQATLALIPNMESGVDTLTVTYTTETETVTNTVNYHSNGDEFFGQQTYELAIVGETAAGASSNQLSFATPLTVKATLTLNGSPVSGQNVNFSVDDKGLLASSVVETGSDGIAPVVLTENNVDGAGVVTATYTTEDNQVISKSFSFISAGDGGLQMVLTVTDKENGDPISQSNPLSGTTKGSVEVTLSNNGTLVSNAIVNVSTGGKAATVPSDGQAATQANGKASLELVANNETGVGQLSATYTDPMTSETVTQQYIYYTEGDPDFGDSAFELSIVARNASGQITNELSGNSELTLSATLLQNGSAFENQQIQFTVNAFGTLDPQSGSVLTNSLGVATIQLKDNSVKGAGRVTATFTASNGEEVSRNFNFNSQGDGGLLLIIESIKDGNGTDISEGNLLTKDNKAEVIAVLTEDGSPVQGALVTFTVDDVGTMSPENGRAVTDSQGKASIDLFVTTVSGVGEVTAEYEGITTNPAVFNSKGDAVVIDGNYSFDIRLLINCAPDWDAVRNDTSNPVDPSDCTEVTSVDSSVIPELFIELGKVTSAGESVENQIIEVTTDKGQVLPSSGKVLTDVNGIAILKLQPGDSDGAGTISVSFDGEDASENFSVGIQQLYLQLSADLPASTNPDQPLPELDSGDSFIVTARVFTDEALTSLYEQPVDIGFSSICASQQPAGTLATIDSPVRTQAGVATSTYRASGCNGNDTITASISAADPVNYAFFVKTAPVQSLKFISASNRFIGLPPATGSVAVTSTITFQLIDTDDIPLRQKQIEFRFADLTGEASLNTYKGNTDNDGEAKTLIEGGVVPGGLVVEACYLPDETIAQAAQTNLFPTCWQSKIDQCTADPSLEFCELPAGITGYTLIPANDQINAVSSGVVLSSGVPDQDSFDAAPETYILNTQNYVGITTTINVFFGDQFNQLSKDDLVANVQTEAGVVGNIDGSGGDESYQCFADKGRCQVQWRSQGELPFTADKWRNKINDVCDTYQGQPVPCIGDYPTTVTENIDGVDVTRTVVRGARVTVLATAKGQENFHDKPSTDTITRKNGLFDIGEFQPLNDDLPEAFIDFNGNNQFDAVDCDPSNGEANDPCEPTLSNGGHNEPYLDANNNGRYDGLPADPTTGIYNGLLCGQAAEEAGQCSKDLVDIRKQFEIVASSDVVYARFVVNKSHIGGVGEACSNPVGPIDPEDPDSEVVTLPVEGLFGLEDTENANYCDINRIMIGDFNGDGENETAQVMVEIYYSDLYGNTLPEGTTVSISTQNGSITVQELTGTIYASGGFDRGKAVVLVTPENAANNLSSGNLIVTFTIPDPNNPGETIVRTKTLTIQDNG